MIRIQKLVTSPDSYNEILIDFFLKEKSSIVVLLISLHEFPKFGHPCLKSEEKGEISEHYFKSPGSNPKLELVQRRIQLLR